MVEFVIELERFFLLLIEQFGHLSHQVGLVELKDANLSQVILCAVEPTSQGNSTTHRLNNVC